MRAVESTIVACREAAAKHDTVIVSYSGGKDSLVTLDLCKRTFKHVRAFFMYFIPGLRCVEEWIARDQRVYGIEIVQYPHPGLSSCIRNGVFCDEHWSKFDLPEWKQRDVYTLVRHDLGSHLIAIGAKKSDSAFRRRTIKQLGDPDKYFLPIKEWAKEHVMAYLAARRIPLPESDNRQASGIDLTVESVCWLHDRYPDDYEKLIRVFPYAPAHIARREFYGIGPHYDGAKTKVEGTGKGNGSVAVPTKPTTGKLAGLRSKA